MALRPKSSIITENSVTSTSSEESSLKGVKAKTDTAKVTSSEVRPDDSPVDELRNRLSRPAWDLNLPDDFKTTSSSSLWEEESRANGGQIEENSPYEEVRAAVPNWDEEMPANTIRAWVLGMTLSIIGSGINTLFSLRQPSISIGAVVAQLVSFALGKAWARWLPSKQRTLFGIRWNLNPGPFNVKEHAVIIVMASVSFSQAYATDIIIAQDKFYGQNFGIGFQILLMVTTQSIGYGIAGFLRKFLVYPAAMIWPGNLVSVTLTHVMHEKEVKPDPNVLGGKMSRFKWFGVIFLGAYLYYWIPGYLFQCLSMITFVTWAYPQNPVVNQLFGGTTGLGLIPLTLDWTTIVGFLGNPMIPPWYAIANSMVGVVIFYIITTIGLHYSGAWYARFLPIGDSLTYDNTGVEYNVSRVTTPRLTLDEAAYAEYSPLLLSTTFALTYGLSFATIASLVVYIYLNFRHVIVAQFKNAKTEKPDIHMKLMQKYPEAPIWWYAGLFLVMLALSYVTVLAYPTEFAWWAFTFAIVFSTVMTLPVGIVQAITNHQIGLNVITEFLMGYMQPGRPLALMMFKTYGYITASHALGFLGDLKYGHYMKIPPRTMFMVQVVGTIISCFVQIFILNFALDNVEGICEPQQAQRFTCPGARVFYSASVIWGLLGPQRMFSPGQIYSALLFFFPIGVAFAVALHFAAKRFPNTPLKYAMAPLILGGGASIPPATPFNYLTWGAVGFIFQRFIRRRYFAWWARLNYLTASGLDTGLAVSTLTIFFIFTLNQIQAPQWWGNTVFKNTMDMTGTAVQDKVASGNSFGPENW
ncbi:OPT family small oligopeptide transporter [Lineolata rhizophorae]|uniref:OPT family small oligopeptide transporter n=1 Tax=Lineolata rhizophorae TaxID=578093 RepID=A0A6A6NQD8_9PEZI|nr:OPT family small oligopeptide transporter [Lineolata rhizophorae]